MSSTPARARAATTLLAVFLVSVAACGGGGGGKAKATTTTVKINSTVALRLLNSGVASIGPDTAFPNDLRDTLTKSVAQYVESAVVAPLRSGAVPPDLARIFTAGAGAKLNGPDRPALTDEGVPTLTGSITPATAAFSLHGLADKAGEIVLVAAALDLDLHAPVAGGDLHVVRTGDLLFANEGGSWRVAGYDMTVQRNGPGVQVAAGHATKVPTA